MKRFILYVSMLLLIYGCSTNKPFSCFEYDKNYMILFSNPPSSILKNNLKLTKSERTTVKDESCLPINFYVNTCDEIVNKIEISPVALLASKRFANSIDSNLRKKITQCLMDNIEIKVLPLREQEEVKCDSNIVLYLWIKYH